MNDSPDGRQERNEALTERLHRAVFVSPAAAQRALNDPAASLRIELLKGVLLGADYAMQVQGIDEHTRDLVAHQIIFGDPPQDPTAARDEQIEQARTTPVQIPEELLAGIPTPEQQATDLLQQLQGAVEKLWEGGSGSEVAWEITRETVDWAMSLYGPPGELHGAYVVVLKDPIEDDAAEEMMRLLMRVRGVVAVVPMEDDHQTRIAEERVRGALSDALSEVLDPFWSTRRPAAAGSV